MLSKKFCGDVYDAFKNKLLTTVVFKNEFLQSLCYKNEMDFLNTLLF
jgi:hypothetical protein